MRSPKALLQAASGCSPTEVDPARKRHSLPYQRNSTKKDRVYHMN